MAIFNPTLIKPEVAEISESLNQTITRTDATVVQETMVWFGSGTHRLTGFQIQLSHSAPAGVNVELMDTKIAELLPGGAIEIEEFFGDPSSLDINIPAGAPVGDYLVMGYVSAVPINTPNQLPTQV